MNEPLPSLTRRSGINSAWVATTAAVLGLVVGGAGCATHRPAALLVEHQVPITPRTNSEGLLNLRLVTYNIWGLPSWMTGARPGRFPQIAQELERLNPDIILLQEAWTPEARKSAPTNDAWAIARAAGQEKFSQQSGLMTLSKWPVIGGGFYPFSRAAFPDRLVNKGVLKVTVQLPDGNSLNIWNVHMQQGGSAQLRMSQVSELVARVQAARDGQIADIIGGDFNCTPESSVCQELMASLGPSVQSSGGSKPFVTWDGLSTKSGAGQTIDYVFILERTPLEELHAMQRVAFTASNPEQRLSDHLGIEAEVSLRPAQSLAAHGAR